MKRRPGSKHSIHHLSKSLKKIGKSVGRRNPGAIARQVMAHARIKREILKCVGRAIRKDMKHVCSKKLSSILRCRSAEDMKNFTWDALHAELDTHAPVFCHILNECIRPKRRETKTGKSRAVIDTAVVGLCSALLLRHWNQRMNLVQRIISTLLYSGHAPKQVFYLCHFRRMYLKSDSTLCTAF